LLHLPPETDETLFRVTAPELKPQKKPKTSG